MFKRVPQVPFRFERLEPRILLSADPVTTGVALLAADSANDADDINDSLSSSFPKTFPTLTEKSDTIVALSLDDVGAFFGGESEPPRTVVFLDSRVDDYRTLLDGIDDDVDVVMLDQNEDGIGQISKYLADTTNVGAMHVVSHGNEQGVWIGETWLDNDTLGDRSEDVAAWSNSLAVDADILFYGCNLAAGADGQLLIQRLSDLSGADIAASTNLTGSTQLGGDWEFEYQLGALEDGAIFNAAAQAEWHDVLALQAYESFDYAAGSLDTENGGTGWASAWNTSGGSSALVNTTGLTDPSGLLPTQGGTAEMNTTAQFIQTRDLGTAIGADGTTIWASFLLKVDTLSGGISLQLGDSAGVDDYVTVGTNNNDFIITKDGNTVGASYINNVLTDSQTYFMAVKMDFAAGNDTVTLYVDPTPGLASPDSPGAWTAQLTSADMGSFTEIGMTGGFSGNNSNIDEIRFGDSFADVAPGSYFLDQFNTDGSFAGDDGTLSWTNDWQEVGEANGAASGDVRVFDNFSGDGGGNIELRISDNLLAWREADLSGFTSATLSFDYARVSVEAGDDLVVYAGSSGGASVFPGAPGNWEEIARYPGAADDASYLDDSIDITSYIANDTRILFKADGATNVNDKFFVDDVLIDLSGAVTATALTADPSAGAPYAIAEGGTLNFDGSDSWDPDGTIVSYEWDILNDGTFEKAGLTASFNWAELVTAGIDDDGTYDVALRVTDDGSNEDISVFQVAVTNTAPTISVSGAATTGTGVAYTLNIAASDPGADTITGWTINWGDGSIDTIIGNPPSVNHTYTNSGFTNNILVSATDEDDTYIAGDLLLTSNNTDSLFRFDATDGSFEIQFAGGGLNNPLDIEIGPDGLIYVTGFASNDVHRFNPATGAWIDEFVNSNSGGLTQATRMAFGPDGNLYITSYSTHEVLRYNGVSGAFIDAFVTAGLGTLDTPDGIAFGPDGDLYVASDGNGKVLRYDGSDGTFLGTFANLATTSFTDLTFGPDGNLYVSQVLANNVQRYDGSSGAYINDFVAVGSGGINGAAGLKFGADGDLYVVGFNSNDVYRYDGGDGTFRKVFVPSGTGQTAPINLTFTPAHQVKTTDGQLWFSTSGNVSSHSGGPGSVASWGAEDIVEISDPGFTLEPGTTAGTFSIPFDLSGPVNIDAIDYVTSTSITIGSGTTFTLNAGDVLFSINENGQTFTSSNTLNNVDAADVVVFRPDTPGDYSAGNFYMLLDNPTGNDLEGISLIETPTDVGDHTLTAGSFVYVDGGGTGANDVKIYTPGNVGAGSTSGGSVQTLINGDEVNLSSDKIIEDPIVGIEVVETGMTLGGEGLQEGDILLSMVGGGKTIGDNSQIIDNEDIGLLRVDKTTLINGTTESTGSMLLEGNDVGLGGGAAEFDGIAIKSSVSDPNDAPTISGAPFDLGSTDEDTISTGVQVSNILAGFTTGDADGDTLGIAVTDATGNNVWQFSTDSTDGTDGNWTNFSAVNVTSALLLSNTSWVRYSPDTINPENVSLTFRAWDGTSGTASTFGSPQNQNPGAGGGITPYSNTNGIANLTVTDVNDVPTLTILTTVVDTTAEEAEVEITFAELAAQGNEADVDGTVDAFVVKAISTGTLKIGTSAIAATAWGAGSNDTINGTLNAYWTPATDDTGTVNAFTVVAEDNDGDESTPAITAQVTVTPVNDAPTLSGGPFNLGSTDEDTISTGVQVSTILGGFTIGDAEGDTLGLAITTATGNNVWQFSTDSTDGTDGNWTNFSAVNVTSALLLSNTSWVRYSPDTINPENVSLTFRAWDGTSGTASTTGTPQNANPGAGGDPTAYSTANGIANLTVTDINDVPTLTTLTTVVDSTAEETEVEITFAELAAQGNEADVDGTVDAFVVKAISTGTLKIGTSAIAATAWAAGSNDTINGTLNAYWTPATNDTGTVNAFTVVAEDNDGDESTPAVTAQVTVTPVNDAPTISGGPFNLGSTDEDTISTGVQVSTILGGFTTGDAEGDTLGLAITTATGNNVWQFSTDSTDGVDGDWTNFSAVNVTSALLLSNTSWVRYSPDTINPENVSLTFRAWDGTSGTASTTGTPQNANPGAGGDPTAYSTANGIANLTVTDINDVPTLTTLTTVVDSTAEETEVEITFAELAAQGNEADVDGTVDAFVVKAISTGTLKIGTSAIAATAWAAGSNDTINGTLNAYWTPATNDNGTVNAFTVVAEDNDGDESTPAVTAQVTVTPVNDQPDLVGTPTNPTATEVGSSTGPVALLQGGSVTVTDPDAPTFNGGAITVALDGYRTGDVLSVTGAPVGISTVTGGSAADLTITLNAFATAANVATILEAIRFTHNGDDPIAKGADPTRIYDITLNDGGNSPGPALDSNTLTGTITLADQNDVPTFTTLSGPVDSANALAEEEIRLSDIVPLSNAADVDGTVDGYVVKAIVSGTLRIGTSAGAATAFIAGVNDTINATNHAYWTSAPAASGLTDAFDLVAIDNDGAESVPLVRAQVTVFPTNQAPTVDQNTLTINEGQAKIMNAADLAASDVDNPDPGLTISVSGVSNGQFERVSNPGIGIAMFAQSDLTGGGIQFVHDGGENPPSYSITVSDGALSSAVSPATIFFTNLNDVPSIGLNKLTIDQGGSVTLTVGAELSSSDPDDGAKLLTYSVISVAGGQFERTDGSGVATTFTQADVNAGLIRFVHDGGDDAPAYTLNVSDGTSNSKQSIAEIVFNPKEGNDFFDSEEQAASDEATEDALENIPDPTSDPDPEVKNDKPEPDPEETPPEEAPTTEGQQAIDDAISNTGPTLLATTTYDGEILAITDQQTDYDRDGNRQGFLDKVRALLTDPLKSDAALVDPLLNQVDSALDLMVGIVQQSNFRNGLDSLRDDVADDAFIEKAKVGSTVAVSTGLSVGYVVWLIRGGVLLSSMLSALPAWRFIDPLPVLAFMGGDDEEDDESLESLVNNDAAANDAVQKPAELDPKTASKDGNA